MSRLRRLRSWWRSLFPKRLTHEGYWSHRALNLLPMEYRNGGTPPERGSWVLSASIGMREPGTRTPATTTTAAFSSSFRPGDRLAVERYRQQLLTASSSTGPGSSGRGTAAPGVSGAPRGRAT